MEAASLYAFAAATGNPVVCFAHVTNQMASVEHDFEKGDHNGATDALTVIATTLTRLQADPLDTDTNTDQAHEPADERSNSLQTPLRNWLNPSGSGVIHDQTYVGMMESYRCGSDSWPFGRSR